MKSMVCIAATSILVCHICVACKDRAKSTEPSTEVTPSILFLFTDSAIFAETVAEVVIVFRGQRFDVTNHVAIQTMHGLLKSRVFSEADRQRHFHFAPAYIGHERCILRVQSRDTPGKASIVYVVRKPGWLEMIDIDHGPWGKPLLLFHDEDQKLWRSLTGSLPRSPVGSPGT